eukprot:4843945-Amphidinium_carterae.1
MLAGLVECMEKKRWVCGNHALTPCMYRPARSTARGSRLRKLVARHSCRQDDCSSIEHEPQPHQV